MARPLSVRLLMTCVATSFLASAAPVKVLNKGIGGHTSANGLSRYARDVEKLAPDHLILYFGINDALNSGKLVPLANFRANLQQMIDRARKLKVKTIILTTPNPIVASYLKKRHPTHPQQDLDAWLKAYDQVVRELAKKNALPLADLRKRFLDHQPDQEAKTSLIRNLANSKSMDGVHPTAEGYKVIAQLMAETLGDAVKPGDRVVCMGDSITFGSGMTGAGTATGDTYPAQLSLLLNKKPKQARADR